LPKKSKKSQTKTAKKAKKAKKSVKKKAKVKNTTGDNTEQKIIREPA